jgi:hypothetical protein
MSKKDKGRIEGQFVAVRGYGLSRLYRHVARRQMSTPRT